MKKIFVFIAVLTVICALFGCQKKTDYRDDLSCSEILDEAQKQLPVDMGYKSLGGEHIKYNFDNTELDDDHSFLSSVASENINEMGIFHAPDESAKKELLSLTEKYLKNNLDENEAFIASYAPEELEKLKKAEVRDFGNYVAYAILSKDDRALFFDTVEKLLAK